MDDTREWLLEANPFRLILAKLIVGLQNPNIGIRTSRYCACKDEKAANHISISVEDSPYKDEKMGTTRTMRCLLILCFLHCNSDVSIYSHYKQNQIYITVFSKHA